MKNLPNILVRIFVCLCLFSLCSCQKREGKILSQSKMSKVLADVYLTDAMLQQIDRKTKSNWSRGMKDVYFQDIAYRWILDKYHITEDDFYASVDYYSRRYKTSANIYEQAAVHLQQMQLQVNRLDSLQKVEEARLLFEQTWKMVEIDTISLFRWFDLCRTDSFIFPKDTLCFVETRDTINYAEWITDYWMSIAAPDSSLMKRPMDHLSTDTIYLKQWEARLDSISKANEVSAAVASKDSIKLSGTDSVKISKTTKVDSSSTNSVGRLKRSPRSKELDSSSKLRTNDRGSR